MRHTETFPKFPDKRPLQLKKHAEPPKRQRATEMQAFIILSAYLDSISCKHYSSREKGSKSPIIVYNAQNATLCAKRTMSQTRSTQQKEVNAKS